MARGITIKVSRIIETRERRKDEVRVSIWTGTAWVCPTATPRDPNMAKYFGSDPKVVTAKIKFLPPGVVPYDALLYRQILLPKMRKMGAIQ